MHKQGDLKEFINPVWVACSLGAAHTVNESLFGGTLWGYPAPLSCWIAARRGAGLLATVTAGSDKTQLRAFVLPVKPPQFPHGETAGKKRRLCLCPLRNHGNLDECGAWLNSLILKRARLPPFRIFLWFDPMWPLAPHTQGDVIENEQLRHVRTELALTNILWKTHCSQRGVNGGIH